MNKQYVLTDGIKFIKYNEQLNPVKVNQISEATIFNSLVDANNRLLAPQMTKINKENGKRKFNIEEVEGELISNKYEGSDQNTEDDILAEINELDGTYKDFDDFKVTDRWNKHVYTGKTLMEDDDFDFPEYMKQAINVFSQLKNYVENMAYLEQESDLKLLDLRHFKRDEETRLNSVEAGSLEYLEQELERERIEYKRNKIIGAIILKKLDRLKKTTYIKVVDNLLNSDYNYRRLDKDAISEMISNRRKSKLKVV